MPAVASGSMSIGGEHAAQEAEHEPQRGPAHRGRILGWRS
jgi:hypothetical protein